MSYDLDKNFYRSDEATRNEHDDTSNVALKRVGLYGWDDNALEWVRLGVESDGALVIQTPPAHVSTLNSTSTPLAGGDTFTGTAEEVLDYALVMVNVKSSHASATNGLVIEFSPDGTNWDNNDMYTIPAATGKTFTAQRSGRYFRIRYTNGATLQTYFRLEVLLSHTDTKPSSHRVQDTISDDDDAELVEAVLKLRTAQNTYVSGSATNSGNFKVSLEEYNGSIKNYGLPVRTSFNPNDIEEASATVTYIGLETEDGTWMVKKIDTTSGVIFGYASVANNPTRTSYTLGWDNRATLTYGDYQDIL